MDECLGWEAGKPDLKRSHADLAVVFGAFGDCQPTHLEVAGQDGFLFQGEEAPAGHVAVDQSVNPAFLHFHRAEEFHFGPLFHPESPAMDLAGDSAMAADDKGPRAIGIPGKTAFHDEVVALDEGSANKSFFVDMDIAPGFDRTGPFFVNFLVLHGDEAAALVALTGIGVNVRGMAVPAFKAGDFTGLDLSSLI